KYYRGRTSVGTSGSGLGPDALLFLIIGIPHRRKHDVAPSAPLNASVRKAASAMSPMAVLAPHLTRPSRSLGLLPTTVTSCPFLRSSSVSGLDTCPAAPVTTNFIATSFP